MRSNLKPIEVVQRWIELFNQADLDAIMSLYADEATLHLMFADPIKGRISIHGAFTAYFAAGNLYCNVGHLHDAGEFVILEWTDASGLPGANFYQIQDGQIVHQRNYFDQLTFLRKMGIPLPTE
ncbi:MAG: nuclear transport factor 2 family protein [Myxococcales bacterium]|nr:nuclear transport factor 2 family protein [Myxococcales bacterium]